MATRFIDLPDLVKTWLLSQEVTGHIIAIEQRLEMAGDEIKIIPRLITQLVIGRLPPTQFIARLQEKLGLNFEEARATTQEIYAKILKPVAVSLRNEGVDAAVITEGGPLTRTPQPLRQAARATTPPPNLPTGDEPFILHREVPTKPSAPLAQKPPEVKPTFRYQPPTPVKEKPIPPAPPKARVETPSSAPRTVHYSGPTTKLSKTD